MFDFDAAFQEFLGKFRNKRLTATDIVKGRALWDTQVNGDDETASACHAQLLAGLTEKATSEWTPSYTLARIFGAKLKPVGPSPFASTLPAAPAAPPAQDLLDFQFAWALWPKDPTRLAESDAMALYGWQRAVARYGLQTVKDATTYYTARSRGLDHPMNLLNFLENEDVKFYAERQNHEPDAADMAAFQAAYSRYPKPALDEAEALDLFVYRITTGQRLEFLAAVIQYARQVADKDAQYVSAWASFCAEAWRNVDAKDLVWGVLWRLLGCGASASGRVATPAGLVAEELENAIVRINNSRVENLKLYEAGEWDGWHPPRTELHTMTVSETMARAYEMFAEYGHGASTAMTPEQLAVENAACEAREKAAADALKAAIAATDCEDCRMFKDHFEDPGLVCPGCREQRKAA